MRINKTVSPVRIAPPTPAPAAVGASKTAATKPDGFDATPSPPAKASKTDGVLDGIQTALDVAGLVPGVGEVADLANAGISALRGDYVGAGLSLVSMIPGVGDAIAKPIKLALKAGTKLPAKEAAAVLAQLQKHGPDLLNKLEGGIKGIPGVGQHAASIAGGLRTAMRTLEGQLSPAKVSNNLYAAATRAVGKSGADGLGATISQTAQTALRSGDRDAARKAIRTIDELASKPGAQYTPDLKALRRKLTNVANAPAPKVARPNRAASDVFGNGGAVPAARATAAREAVSNPKAFVTGTNSIGDFRSKGAHVHVKVGGKDIEVSIKGVRKPDGSLGIDTGIVATNGSKGATVKQLEEAQRLLRDRLTSDGGFRTQLHRELSNAIQVAGKEAKPTQQLPAAKLLERALNSTAL
jgi:hypothetical protein